MDKEYRVEKEREGDAGEEEGDAGDLYDLEFVGETITANCMFGCSISSFNPALFHITLF